MPDKETPKTSPDELYPGASRITSYRRSDLIASKINSKLEDLDYSMLKQSAMQTMILDHVSIFDDVDGRHKILKNRFGISGIIY